MAVLTKTHPDNHDVLVHNIGAGLQRTLCQSCDYVGVDEAPLRPSDIGITIPIAKFPERPATDPWGIDLAA